VAVSAAYMKKLGVSVDIGDDKLPVEFVNGLKEVKWRGRCEVRLERGIKWCIDRAHTLDSIEVTAKWFAEKLRESGGKAVLIFNQQDRNAAALLEKLYSTLQEAMGNRSIFTHAVFCTNTPSKAESAERPSDLTVQDAAAKAWSDLVPDTDVRVCCSIEEGVEYVAGVTMGTSNPLVLVTGSLYLVGGFIKVIDGDLLKTP